MNDALLRKLKTLRLSGLSQSLEVRLQEAVGHGLNHVEFLELILEDELMVRQDRLVNRRIKAARFRDLKTVEDFDFSFNTSIRKKQIYDLAAGHFLRNARDVLWLGPPALLILGAAAVVLYFRRRRAAQTVPSLSADEQRRIDTLLGG